MIDKIKLTAKKIKNQIDNTISNKYVRYGTLYIGGVVIFTILILFGQSWMGFALSCISVVVSCFQ